MAQTFTRPLKAGERYQQRLEVVVPENEWLSANSRFNRWEKARRVKALRTRAFWLARAAGLTPADGRALVVAGVQSRVARRSDPANASATTKPLVDGLVDAGVFPDDDHTHVVGPHHVHMPPDPSLPRGGHRIVLEIRELDS